MSKKNQILLYITIIVIALCTVASVIILMPPCPRCGEPFHFGDCTEEEIPSGFSDLSGINVTGNNVKVSQNTVRLAETNMASDDYLDNITFIGDSRTVAYYMNGLIDKSRVFADNGLSHEQAMTAEVVQLDENKLTTIETAVMVTSPDIAIINFGINGAGWMDNKTFMEGYVKLVESLINASPNTIFVLEAILPVSADYELREDGIANERIDELNDLIYEYAGRAKLFYLASNEVLKGDNNALDMQYSSDGLHYNKSAYTVLLDYIKTHAIYRE